MKPRLVLVTIWTCLAWPKPVILEGSAPNTRAIATAYLPKGRLVRLVPKMARMRIGTF